MSEANVKQRFGSAIKTWRAKSGISQEELAWRSGLHRTYVADIERGARNPSLESLQKLARGLNVSISTLFKPLEGAIQAGSGESDEWVDILLVEEHPDDVELTLTTFRKANVKNRIHVARDGVEALEYLFGTDQGDVFAPGNRPQLILLDLYLPRVDGLEVLRQIKGDPQTSQIPVIVLTVSAKGGDLAESRRLGADLHIVKPVDFNRFCEVAPRLNCYWGLFRSSRPATGQDQRAG